MIANELLAAGLQRGDRVAVLLPNSPMVHAVYVGIERAGVDHRRSRAARQHLVIVDELPQASGGKIAKSALRDDVKAR